MPIRNFVSASALLVALLFVAGCGSQLPPMGQVSGKVLLDGTPLSTGSVLFIPEAAGQYAFGTVQKDGTYTLTTFVNGDGALVGRHKIIVSAVKETKEGEPVIPLTPSKYSNENTSGLTAQVLEGVNQVDLELVSGKGKKGS
ncbi:hypothetical protein [Planctomicrobium sp. SH664]|uniref:hypothetical protein n=1 Tax=Planctomicrobium sp. SH664 TaxID=3448125 RepID=UPI003F5C2BDA